MKVLGINALYHDPAAARAVGTGDLLGQPAMAGRVFGAGAVEIEDPYYGSSEDFVRACVPIPKAWRDEKLVLRFLVGPRDGYSSTAETQLYVNGFPLQAIDVWHEEAWLPPEYTRLDEIVVALRAWNGIYLTPPQRRFKEAALIVKVKEPQPGEAPSGDSGEAAEGS